ncbi:hypothetical protein ACSS6W_000459 [Trichoderma asperelloides]
MASSSAYSPLYSTAFPCPSFMARAKPPKGAMMKLHSIATSSKFEQYDHILRHTRCYALLRMANRDNG